LEIVITAIKNISHYEYFTYLSILTLSNSTLLFFILKINMKFITKTACGLTMLILLFGSGFTLMAQITVYQYRHVPDNKIEEFIKREAMYWSKVAQKAITDKKMTFWAVLEKVGGYDLPNSSNFLFINTYSNIDSAGDIWGSSEAVAGVKIEEMETNSISTTTSQFFLHDENFVMAAGAMPDKDFNYVKMIYHNSNYPDSLVALEKKFWGPFIQKAMDKKQTRQMAWGNASILAPSGDNIKFNTVSYDLFPTLQDALIATIDRKAVFPTKGLNMIDKIEINRRGAAIYRIVKAISAN
jgi:hypothetical protein